MDPVVLRRVQRILELPGLIEPLVKQRTALRAERRTTERKLAKRTVEVKRVVLEDDAYRAASNQTERDIILASELEADDECLKLGARVDQLTTSIEKVVGELEVLDHERKALKAALEREYAAVIEQLQSDRILADVATSRRVPKGVA